MSVGDERSDENRLLAALKNERSRLPVTEVGFSRGDVLVDSGHRHHHLFFPHVGLISLVVDMPDGATAEAAMIGPEGFVGHPFLADFDASPSRAVAQTDGRAARIGSDAIRAALSESPVMRRALGDFGRAFLAQLMQNAACNLLHGLRPRFAKWLLQCVDRTNANLWLTQEVLATILGVSRQSINQMAASFQSAGIIQYRRREIEVRDRAGLEAVACPCYGTIRRAYGRLLSANAACSAPRSGGAMWTRGGGGR